VTRLVEGVSVVRATLGSRSDKVEGGARVARVANGKQAALARARERRIALDEGRDARDRRIEETAAEAFVLLAERAAAEAKVSETSAAIGERLRRLLAEDVGADGVAQLVDLDVAEVRRLTRPAAQRTGVKVTGLPIEGAASADGRRSRPAATGDDGTDVATRQAG
jgi:hypothetical protein